MRYLAFLFSKPSAKRVFVGVVASTIIALCLGLNTQPHKRPSTLFSHLPELNQIVDKELEAKILEAVDDHKWDDALSAIRQQRARILNASDKARIVAYNNDDARAQTVARVLPALEEQRSFLAKLAQSFNGKADDAFVRGLINERIAVNFSLIVVLDLEVAQQVWKGYRWSGISYNSNKISWFWQGVADAQSYYDQLEKYDWHRKAGVPLNNNGDPVLFDVPEMYSDALGCGEKILFLASEIEGLDPTAEKHNAGRIMLYRARLARRLFGPTNDPEWELFTFDLYGRPSFIPSEKVHGMTPVHELSDHETRVQVGSVIQQLSLPSNHSPLALYREIEKRYPNCDSVARAMYEVGQYYQMRRQFTAAAREYRRVIAKFPKHQRSILARKQLDLMKRSDVLLGRSGVYLPGSKPKIWFRYRNTSTVEFTLRRLNVEQFLADQSDGEGSWRRTPTINAFGDWGDDEDAVKNAGGVFKSWRVDQLESSMQAATSSTTIPHGEIGEYLLEAQIPGTEEISRAIILVTSVAIIHQKQAEQALLTIVDARSGDRLPNETLRVIQRDAGMKKLRSTPFVSNEAGEVVVPANEEYAALISVRTKGHGKAFLSLYDYVGHSRTDSPVATYTTTDRPAYRPGEEVHFRSWYREEFKDDPLACPDVGTSLSVLVVGPGLNVVKQLELVSDESGSIAGAFNLGKEAALGLYKVFVTKTDDPDDLDPYWMYRLSPSTQFRVEEYKRPEYRVRVTPIESTNTADEVAFQLEAKYYFGDPVSNAEVDYTLYRQFKQMSFAKPQPYDWLYGPGYGRYGYLYPWLGDAMPQRPDPAALGSWHLPAENGVKVASGSAKLDAMGRAVLRLDTPEVEVALNQALQYRLVINVVDDGRRTVSAEGTTIVAQKEFFTFAELDRGWYKQGDAVQLTVSTLDPNSMPTAADIEIELLSVGALSSSNASVSQEVINVQRVSTRGGSANTTFADLPIGQYRLELQANDSDDLAASVNFVVFGDQLNDRPRRYGDLELIPREATYEQGDTAEILVNVNQYPIQLTLENHDGLRRSFDLTEQSSVIEIPVTSKHTPSTWFQASAVRDGKLLQEHFGLFVPPDERMLQVSVDTEAYEYQPGGEATVRVAVADDKGKPVAGDVALAVYDASVLAIQPAESVGPKRMLLATKPSAWDRYEHGASSSLGTRQFDSSGDFWSPEYALADEKFYGPWSPDEPNEDNADPREITTHRGVGLGGSPPPTGDFTPGQSLGAAQTSTASGNEAQLGADDEDSNAARRQYVQPVVRNDYSATAAWVPHLRLDESGIGEAQFTLPDSLTTWNVRAFSITSDTKLGDGSGTLITTKPLLVRLQTPRFLVDQDEVVVSANVHNDLADAKDVRVELSLPSSLLQPEDAANPSPETDGQVVLVHNGRVAAGASQRFDWRLRAIHPGKATLMVKALTDEVSDAMAKDLQIIPFAALEHQSQSISLGSKDIGEFHLKFDMPGNLLADSLTADLNSSASPANALFDTIPFLIDYPYGCVEQTLSRFYPLAIATDALQRLDIQAEDLKQLRRDASTVRRRRARGESLLDSDQMDRIADLGLQRLYRFQHSDGGWGWWENDPSTPFMTAYVLVGLNTAAKAGIEVRKPSIDRGRHYLASWFRDSPNRASEDIPDPQHLAYMVYALSLPWDKFEGSPLADDEADSPSMQSFDRELKTASRSLQLQQSKRNHYGHCLMILALHNAGETQESRSELRELLTHLQNNGETAALPTDSSEWWRWWNSDIETNAWLLRALVAIDPDNPVTEKVVQWLVDRRKNGAHWRSTRDSALAVLALSEYLVEKRAETGRIDFEYAIDDGSPTQVEAPDLPFHPDTSVQLKLAGLLPGEHALKISKTRESRLHLSLNLQYQRIVDSIAASHNGISIERTYRKVAKRSKPSGTVTNSDSQDTFQIGDIIEVELRIRTEQSYEYLAFEDPKPAGCEPLQLQSGSAWDNGLWGNVELRDQNVVFFGSYLSAGEHVLKYKLRAETPGVFRAMPTTGFAMYTPEIRGNTTENIIVIHEN